ncbi:uncharacterized protein [Primulina eburnea]|uniref:uncharacterized protein n=1 Tax=Primulina eburnea TaxID=1245227 RepID=UPI003C6BDA1B
MECNKDEAIRAKDIAEKKLENNDFEGAQKMAKRAQSIYPELENIMQLITICDVHCSSEKRLLGSDKDWYAILKVDCLADQLTIKKQYRRLALFLHPDKNRFPGAESAFKLICEANAVLSDPVKKSLYDKKIKVSSRYAPANVPTVNKNKKKSQFPIKPRSQNSVRGNLNRNQAAQSSSSARLDAFWTACPFCRIKYQYQIQFVNRLLRCQKCLVHFMAYEESAEGVSSESKQGQHDAQPMTSKPSFSQPAAFTVKENQADFKMDTQNENRNPSSFTDTHDNANMKPVQQEQGINMKPVQQEQGIQKRSCSGAAKTESVARSSRDSKAKARGFCTVNLSNGHMEGKTSNVDAGAKDLDNRGRKRAAESGESLDELRGADARNMAAGVGCDNTATEMDSGPRVLSPPRSSSKRQHVIYNGSDGDLRGKTGADAAEIKSDSGKDSYYTVNSDGGMYEVPDPEFGDFDKDRDESLFAVDQIWACYDTVDGMPRFYAKVKKILKSPFGLRFTWFEADPKDESDKKWVDEGLPAGCGRFELGRTEETRCLLSLSHKMCCKRGQKRGSFVIHPGEGETWLIFKDWSITWNSVPDKHEFKYEIVEVLSDFVAGSGIEVCHLDKIRGFVSLFQRTSQSKSFYVGPKELYRFSHRVPCFKMTGHETAGVPEGSFELDPASLPLNPENLYYPGKATMEREDLEHGVNGSSAESAKQRSEPMISEGKSTPKDYFEGTDGESLKLRRSPRKMKFSGKKGN